MDDSSLCDPSLHTVYQPSLVSMRPQVAPGQSEALVAWYHYLHALMVESADTPDSKPGAERREGSTPSQRTNNDSLV